MKLVRMMAFGVAALGFAAGTALAQEATYYDIYGVDEDRDGVIDSYLVIEESDTRA